MRLQESEVESDHLDEEVLEQENVKIETVTGSAANKFTKAGPTEAEPELM